jgi:hypothetical protein
MNKFIELTESKEIYLYGAGNLGKKVAAFFQQNNIAINGFLDKNKRQEVINGVNVFDPFTENVPTENALVIVSIFNRDYDYLSVKKQLQEINFTNIISYIEFFSFCGMENSRYWLSCDKDYLRNEDVIQKVSCLFKEKLSRQIFGQIIKARQNSSYEDLPIPYPIKEQYFSKDVSLRNYDNFIDCGAYDGDTLEAMDTMGVRIENIYAFEPDLDIFARLMNKAKMWQKRAVLFPCGVGANTQQLQFEADGGEGGRIIDSQCFTPPLVYHRESTAYSVLHLTMC